MPQIYLDSAATTTLRKEVIDTMIEVLQKNYGNASSTHSFGRSSKTIIETSRKSIAKILNCHASEIIFTSSATEGTNWVLKEMVKNNGIKKLISSKIEHHATLYTVKQLEKEFGLEVVYTKISKNGCLDEADLIQHIENSNVPTLVTLMHVNNEIGTVLNIEKIAQICQENNVKFHCDTVQSVGKTLFDLEHCKVDFLVASAHKFHGPKGVGFAFVRKNNILQPLLYGGEQEKGLRAGTEATHQIAAMTKALEIATQNYKEEFNYIKNLKDYCISQLNEKINGIKVNGENTFYNILNILLPFSEEKTAMILFNLDMKGIAVSRGSACQSGSQKPSHVLAEFVSEEDLKKPALRISFSHENTKEEIDYFIQTLLEI
jgi:cysteine desulfurase